MGGSGADSPTDPEPLFSGESLYGNDGVPGLSDKDLLADSEFTGFYLLSNIKIVACGIYELKTVGL